MTYLTGRNIVGLSNMARQLVASLQTAGFKLIAVDKALSTVVNQNSKDFCLDASVDVDSMYENQKWSILISVDKDAGTMSMNVLPKNQINSQFEAVQRASGIEIGRISVNGSTENFFIDLTKVWGVNPDADDAAFPLSYDLSVTGHGVALHVNVEGMDNVGTAFSWFVAQRGVIAETGEVDPNSPLFAVYSIGGGQKADPDKLVPESIQRFTVIERDVSAATAAMSAVVPSADGIPIINPMQQVMIAEGNKAIVLFPHMINSQRYLYHVVLDMLGYTSADVISAASQIDLSPANVPTTYRALNANGKDNRGMRVLFPVEVVQA